MNIKRLKLMKNHIITYIITNISSSIIYCITFKIIEKTQSNKNTQII